MAAEVLLAGRALHQQAVVGHPPVLPLISVGPIKQDDGTLGWLFAKSRALAFRLRQVADFLSVN